MVLTARTLILLAVLLVLPAADIFGQTVRPSNLDREYHRAKVALETGTSFLEAKARADMVIDKLPDDGEARKLRAKVLLEMDRPAEALADANRAVGLLPSDADAYMVQCQAARLTGDYELASRALDAASVHDVGNLALHVKLSREAVLLGYLEKAEALARIAHALDARNAAATHQLARVFALRGMTNEAVTVLYQGVSQSILDPAVVAQDSILAEHMRDPRIIALTGEK